MYNLPSDWQINQSSWIPPPPPHSNAQFQPDLSSHQFEAHQIFSRFKGGTIGGTRGGTRIVLGVIIEVVPGVVLVVVRVVVLQVVLLVVPK